MPVEPRRRFVLGIDDQREHRGIGTDRAGNGVEQQRGAELPALKAAIDGEAADQRGGSTGVRGSLRACSTGRPVIGMLAGESVV
jgi:hypothetical protein